VAGEHEILAAVVDRISEEKLGAECVVGMIRGDFALPRRGLSGAPAVAFCAIDGCARCRLNVACWPVAGLGETTRAAGIQEHDQSRGIHVQFVVIGA